MTNSIKISQLSAATTPLTGAEVVALVQGGATKQATVTQVFTEADSNSAFVSSVLASVEAGIGADAGAAAAIYQSLIFSPPYTGAIETAIDNLFRDLALSVGRFFASGRVAGTTDDTAAIQAALNSGKDVYFPEWLSPFRLTAQVTAGADYQRIFGTGEAQIIQETANTNGIAVLSRTGVIVEGLKVQACGSTSAIANGNGIYVNASTGCHIKNNLVTNHRGDGICIYDSSDNFVYFNRFASSATPDLSSTSSADIDIVYNSARNEVFGNIINSGQASGIKVQAITSGDNADDNVITGNIVRNAKAYGIIAYRVDSVASISVERTIITGNIVNGVSGTIQNAGAGLVYSFGAGIYAQGAEGTVINGNAVSNTHSGAATIAPDAFSELLAPGAIGATNATRYTISDNVIDTCGMYGIYCGDPNTFGDTKGFAIVSGNAITRTAKSGIKVVNRGRIKIDANTVDGVTSGSGVHIANTLTQRPGISVTNNSIIDVPSTAILIQFASNPKVKGNDTDGSGVHGISVENSTRPAVNDNYIKDHTSRGIHITSTASGGSCLGNIIVGTGSSQEGIRLDAMTKVDRSNSVTGCTTNWAGDYAVLRGFNTATYTFTTTTTETDLQTYTIPANALVVNGDGFKFSAFGTTRNSADTKTLRVYVGATMAFETTLTTGQVSPWRLEVELVRRVLNGQRCFVQMVQGGTTSKIAAEYSNPDQTETSAIVMRVTGQGTVSNDIECFNLNSDFVQAA